MSAWYQAMYVYVLGVTFLWIALSLSKGKGRRRI